MRDGRIACVYGYRLPPFGCARLSADEGRTWGREIVLRDDGGSWISAIRASPSTQRAGCSRSTT